MSWSKAHSLYFLCDLKVLFLFPPNDFDMGMDQNLFYYNSAWRSSYQPFYHQRHRLLSSTTTWIGATDLVPMMPSGLQMSTMNEKKILRRRIPQPSRSTLLPHLDDPWGDDHLCVTCATKISWKSGERGIQLVWLVCGRFSCQFDGGILQIKLHNNDVGCSATICHACICYIMCCFLWLRRCECWLEHGGELLRAAIKTLTAWRQTGQFESISADSNMFRCPSSFLLFRWLAPVDFTTTDEKHIARSWVSSPVRSR